MLEEKRYTKKIYYRNQYLRSLDTKITKIGDGYLEIDETIAYPEGGGQESDTGSIQTSAGPLRYVSAQLLHGLPLHIEGFKGGKSGGIVAHYVHSDDMHMLTQLRSGAAVTVCIDVERRQKLTLSHSASHFLYAAALAIRPELIDYTIGCHIKEEGARFDFLVDTPFTADEIIRVEQHTNEIMAHRDPIFIDVHSEIADARTWRYQDIHIPCGGTHLSSPEAIGKIRVTRKKLGKNKERLMCTYQNSSIDISQYHHMQP